MNLQISSNSELRNPNNGDDSQSYYEDFESACSTPYVSAPSSPGRGSSSSSLSPSPAVSGGFFYSAPASPTHFSLASNSASSFVNSSKDDNSVPKGFEFEFSARFGPTGAVVPGSMSSADELFLNGKIRPMKLSTLLERPLSLEPSADLEDEEEGEECRGRDLRTRDKSLRRRTRSMSPMRSSNTAFEWIEAEIEQENNRNDDNENPDNTKTENEDSNAGLKLTTNSSSSSSTSSSRSSSAGRNSKRWLFLKEFLRSKSEGRSNNKYFWSHISKKSSPAESTVTSCVEESQSRSEPGSVRRNKAKPANGVVEKSKTKGKKKIYEMHYTANRAQAEELRKKTYLPYRQGLLGCLGFSSKGYGAVNGLARALNPVSSR